MQALELLAPAPSATNGEEPPANNLRGSPGSDGEFGRLMEHALSPDKKKEANPAAAPRKSKATDCSVGSHPIKVKSNQDTTASDTNISSPRTSSSDKAKKASNAPEETTTQPKENPPAAKSPADPAAIPPVTVDAGNEPLPVFLSLPLILQFVTGETDGLGAMNQCESSPTQTTPAAGAIKSFSNTTTSQTSIGAGKKPAGTSSGKISADASVTTPLIARTKILEPAGDAKTPAKSAVEGDSKPASVKDKGQNVAATDLKRESSDPVMNPPKPTEEKLRVVPPAADKPVEGLKNDGTGVAITALSMKKTENTNKVAGLDVQVLPGGTNDTARETVLPPHAVVMPVRSSEKFNSDFNLPVSSPLASASTAASDTSETSNIISLPSLTDARMRDVERTHDLVSMHALRMVDSTSNSLQMVIKPGAGTELSLELRHRNGGIEAEAVLQHGDFQLMNQHWPELQHKLEQRGIKLAPLGGEANSSAPDNGNSSRQQPSLEEAAQQASAFAEFTLAMNRGGATARLAPVTAGGWESWA
jgi:hypothetical protein